MKVSDNQGLFFVVFLRNHNKMLNSFEVAINGKIMIRFPLPPKAPKRPHFHSKFGDEREDPYYWMKNKNSRPILTYLKKENIYAKKKTGKFKKLKKTLFHEIKSRIVENYDSEPYKYGDYFYYHSFMEGREYPVYKRKSNLSDASFEVLLDVNEIARGKEYCDLGDLWVSPDGNCLAYALDVQGREFYTIYFKDLKTRKLLPYEIPRVTSDFVWGDNETFFYVQQDSQTLRSYRVFRFDLETQTHTQLFEETDDTFSVSLNKTLSGDFIFLCCSSTETTETHFLSREDIKGSFKCILKRSRGIKYYMDQAGKYFYMLTNQDSAYNFKVMRALVERYNENDWGDLISHNPNIFIEDMNAFHSFIAFEMRCEGSQRVQIFHEGRLISIPFKESNCACSIEDNYEYKTDILRVHYESLTTPPQVYDYHIFKEELDLKWERPVGGSFCSGDYVSKKEFAKASDGTSIPVSVVYKKGLKMDGQNPLLLYGYGSYGISMDLNFNSSLFSLLDRGFVYAIAHIRGGSDLGRKWYEAGKLLQKKNTFTDFVSVAEHLIASNYTNPEHLYAMGGSAGGLLIGACANLRPDLFHGLIALVPFVDVLTTMLDPDIPLSTGEYDEWGNPNQKDFYEYIKSYSPVDNIQPGVSYPHLLVKTGYHDPRVQYWEPAKWVASLRAKANPSRDLIFITEMDTGHFGTTGRFSRLDFVSLYQAFLIHLEKKRKV